MTAAKVETQRAHDSGAGQQGSLQPKAALEIWLETNPELAATKMAFSFSPLRLHRVLVRGRSAGAFPSPYSFPWSAGPRALAVLALTSKAHGQSQTGSTLPCLSGKQGSLAASLDYAIGRKPNWIAELFGADSQNRNLIHRIFLRTNPERKIGESVTLRFNPNLLSAAEIAVYVDGILEDSPERLERLSRELYSGFPKLKFVTNARSPSSLSSG